MLRCLPHLDSRQAWIASQSCAALVAGYGLALRYDWKASSVATTIIVLQTTTLGATLNKALLRLAGTLAGAAVGLVLVACFADDRGLFVLGMAVLTGGCVWAMQKSSHGYAWMLVLLTCAIVGWPAAANPLNTFQTSVDRLTAVTVGILLSIVAQSIVWPMTASRQCERSMRDLVKACREMLQLVRAGLVAHESDTTPITAATKRLWALSTSMSGLLPAASTDSQRFAKHLHNYQQLIDKLVDLSLATIAIADASIEVKRATVPAPLHPALRDTAFELLDQECAATIEQFELPRDGTVAPADSTPTMSPTLLARDDENPPANAPAMSLLRDHLDIFFQTSARVRKSLAEVEVPRHLSPAASLPAGPTPRNRLLKAALAAFQVWLAAAFFLTLNWPLGLQAAMLLVMIFAYANAELPVALLTRPLLQSVALALPLAAVFHFVVMPRVDSFVGLSPWLALLFFPLLYAVASHNPTQSMRAKITLLLVNSLIAISTTPPSYDFASFANTYLGQSGGVGVVLLLAYLFEVRSPRRGLRQLLTALLSESARFLQHQADHAAAPTADPCGDLSQPDDATQRYRKQALQMLAKLKKLSGAVDYGQYPQASHEKLEHILHSVAALVLKLAWPPTIAIHNTTTRPAQAWCVASLTATGNALAACEPVHPPSAMRFRDLELVSRQASGQDNGWTPETPDLASQTEYYRSLAGKISDCQRALNTVDWRRWSGSYF